MDAAREPAPPSPRQRARRGLAVYFAVLVAGSAALQITILRYGGAIQSHGALVLALMWMPALASLIARAVMREHPRDVSFGFGGKAGLSAFGLALAYPLLVGTLAYGAAWTFGLERFEGPTVAFLGRLARAATVGALLSCISATGEEIGWRGYMLTRLLDAGFRRPVLVSGLVWAGWHLPLILSGQYAAGRYPLLSALLFVPGTVCIAYTLARARLASGSVWPAIFLHAAWNSIIQGAFDRHTADGNHTLWTGEGGILVTAAGILVVVVVVMRRPFPLRRTTGEAGTPIRLRDL